MKKINYEFWVMVCLALIIILILLIKDCEPCTIINQLPCELAG